MPLHLVKLSAGAEVVEDLAERVRRQVAENAKGSFGRVHSHITRMFPRRADDILGGGSLYWVIKGVILVRQRIKGFETTAGDDGIERCAILLDPPLIATEAQPRRAFQGWRYLRPEDAPADIKSGARREPPVLRARLAELGLL